MECALWLHFIVLGGEVMPSKGFEDSRETKFNGNCLIWVEGSSRCVGKEKAVS